MKIDFIFKYFFIFLSFFVHFHSQAQYSHKSWVINQLRMLAPNEFDILDKYAQLPQQFSINTRSGMMSSYKSGDEYEYLTGQSKEELLSDMATNVHEINHGLTSSYAYKACKEENIIPNAGDNMYYFQFPDGSSRLVVSGIQFFPSRELVYQIPAQLRTFRFNTYINGTSSTQQDGLLGLMDEFNAYLHSFVTAFKLKPAYMSISDNAVNNYIAWRSKLVSYEESYYEFSYFIMEYLLQARSRYPDLYRQIRDERWFRPVFQQITGQFQDALSLIEDERNRSVHSFASANGFSVSERDGYYWFTVGLSSRGIPAALKDRDKVLPVLRSSRYDAILSDFSLSGW